MGNRTNSSRERILSSAEAIILEKGFSATSIEDIINKAAITKGGFFYHFESKPGLAEALIDRYLRQDDEIFDDLWQQASALSEDPLHQFLIFLKLLAEMMLRMETTHPGCLVASFTYEGLLSHPSIQRGMRAGVEAWRDMIIEKLEQIDARYERQSDMDTEVLANMFTGVVEGGILLARNFDDNRILADQILAYRGYIRMLYGAN